MTDQIVPDPVPPGPVPDAPDAPVPPRPVPYFPGRPVRLRVGEVFVRSAPAKRRNAQPALFVHGLGGSSRNWTDLMAELSRPAPVPSEPVLAGEAIDLPGFGYSPPPAHGDYSVDAHVAAVIALIDQEGHWPVILLCKSLGGAICVRAAARRPDLVRTLTLISPARPDLRPRFGPLRVAAIGAPGFGSWVFGKIAALPAPQRTAATMDEIYADPRRIHPDRFADEVAEVIRRDSLDYQEEAFIRSARSIVAEYLHWGPGSLWGDAARVAAPTLAIYGSHDRLVSPVMAGKASRTFRSASAVVLPQTGHVAMMERPATVARLIREFIAVGTPRTTGISSADTAQLVGDGAGPGQPGHPGHPDHPEHPGHFDSMTKVP
ncbi:MAG: alpha/beta fold hydrolase [Streptosporangiaceae bacterium]